MEKRQWQNLDLSAIRTSVSGILKNKIIYKKDVLNKQMKTMQYLQAKCIYNIVFSIFHDSGQADVHNMVPETTNKISLIKDVWSGDQCRPLLLVFAQLPELRVDGVSPWVQTVVHREWTVFNRVLRRPPRSHRPPPWWRSRRGTPCFGTWRRRTCWRAAVAQVY